MKRGTLSRIARRLGMDTSYVSPGKALPNGASFTRVVPMLWWEE